jgi:DNA modification methylase
MKEIEDKSIDLLYTDPPYEQSIGGGGVLAKQFDYRREALKAISHFEPIEFLETVKSKLKIFNAYLWTSKQLLDVYIRWAKDKKFNWDLLIFAKRNPVPAYNNSYLSDLEYLVFMRDKKAPWNNGLGYEKYKKLMLDNVNNGTGLEHPTIKHQWMVEKCISISSKENDLILDPFLGSGTTTLACKNLKRNYIGIEIESKYVKIAKDRLRQQILI